MEDTWLDADGGDEHGAQQVAAGEDEQAGLLAEAVMFEPAHLVVAQKTGEVGAHVDESNRDGRG